MGQSSNGEGRRVAETTVRQVLVCAICGWSLEFVKGMRSYSCVGHAQVAAHLPRSRMIPLTVLQKQTAEQDAYVKRLDERSRFLNQRVRM